MVAVVTAVVVAMRGSAVVVMPDSVAGMLVVSAAAWAARLGAAISLVDHAASRRSTVAHAVSPIPLASAPAVLSCTTVFTEITFIAQISTLTISTVSGSTTIAGVSDADGDGDGAVILGGARLITIRRGGGIRTIKSSTTITIASTTWPTR